MSPDMSQLVAQKSYTNRDSDEHTENNCVHAVDRRDKHPAIVVFP
jgi:hypothetical protein